MVRGAYLFKRNNNMVREISRRGAVPGSASQRTRGATKHEEKGIHLQGYFYENAMWGRVIMERKCFCWEDYQTGMGRCLDGELGDRTLRLQRGSVSLLGQRGGGVCAVIRKGVPWIGVLSHR